MMLMLKIHHPERTKELLVRLFIMSFLQGLCGGQNYNDFMMEPDSNICTVSERGRVTLTCYSGHGQNVSPVMWQRNFWFVCRTNFTNTCKAQYGPTSDYIVGTTHCNCNRSSSSVTITGVTMNDAQNWTCSSHGLRKTKLTQIVVLKPGETIAPTLGIPCPAPTATTLSSTDAMERTPTLPTVSSTFRTRKRKSSSSSPWTKITSIMTSAASTSVLHTIASPLAPLGRAGTLTSSGRAGTMTTSSSLSKSNLSVAATLTGRSDKYQMYIIIGGVVAGLLLLVIIIVIVVKTRSHRSGPDRKTFKQRLVKDDSGISAPEEDKLVMEENVVYCSGPSDNMGEVVDTTAEGPDAKICQQRLVKDDHGTSTPEEDELVMRENVIYCSGPSDNMGEVLITSVEDTSPKADNVYSVVQKKNSCDECADIYAKPDKNKTVQVV